MPQNLEYIMLIDSEQENRIDHAMHDSNLQKLVTSKYYSEATKKFLLQHNARYGEVIIKYNPYSWRKELIFNTEQDAIIFILKVL